MAEVEPPLFDAVTVYDIVAATVVGVPLIVPVEASRPKPAGNAGEIVNDVTVPVTVGTLGAIAFPTMALIVACGYARFDGAGGFTVIWTVAEVEPPLFDAVTVYDIVAATVVGVPLIVPVEASRAKPAGNAGEIVNDVTVPVTVGASGAIAFPSVALIVG